MIDPLVAPLQGVVSPETTLSRLREVFAQDNVAVVKETRTGGGYRDEDRPDRVPRGAHVSGRANAVYRVTIEVAPVIEESWARWHAADHMPDVLRQPRLPRRDAVEGAGARRRRVDPLRRPLPRGQREGHRGVPELGRGGADPGRPHQPLRERDPAHPVGAGRADLRRAGALSDTAALTSGVQRGRRARRRRRRSRPGGGARGRCEPCSPRSRPDRPRTVRWAEERWHNLLARVAPVDPSGQRAWVRLPLSLGRALRTASQTGPPSGGRRSRRGSGSCTGASPRSLHLGRGRPRLRPRRRLHDGARARPASPRPPGSTSRKARSGAPRRPCRASRGPSRRKQGGPRPARDRAAVGAPPRRRTRPRAGNGLSAPGGRAPRRRQRARPRAPGAPRSGDTRRPRPPRSHAPGHRRHTPSPAPPSPRRAS